MELNWPIIQQYDFIMTSNYFLVSVNLCLDNGHGYKGYTILCDCGGCIMGRFAIKLTIVIIITMNYYYCERFEPRESCYNTFTRTIILNLLILLLLLLTIIVIIIIISTNYFIFYLFCRC